MAGAAALASISVIEEEDLVGNAARLGAFIKARFLELQEKHPFIGHVRGEGLLIGVELVRDRKTKQPLDRAVCVRLFQEALRRGLVSMVYSPHFRVNPPLTMTEAEAEKALAILDEVFGLVTEDGSWR